jgi:GNAT superfamily N-acetyltransferase
MPDTEPAYRPATSSDHGLVRQTLYLALAWDPADPIPPIDVVVAHPEIAKYHSGWMRPGDAAVVAEVDGEFAGMAYYRMFTDDDHGQGYLDSATPELAIAVPHEHRGNGIGTRLMNQLADVAWQNGIRKISLSVSSGNPAAHLYERLGYRYASADDEELMVLDLA